MAIPDDEVLTPDDVSYRPSPQRREPPAAVAALPVGGVPDDVYRQIMDELNARAATAVFERPDDRELIARAVTTAEPLIASGRWDEAWQVLEDSRLNLPDVPDEPEPVRGIPGVAAIGPAPDPTSTFPTSLPTANVDRGLVEVVHAAVDEAAMLADFNATGIDVREVGTEALDRLGDGGMEGASETLDTIGVDLGQLDPADTE